MVDKSSNAEAAHLWKALSEDEIKVNCSWFRVLHFQISRSFQSLDEFVKLVQPSQSEVPLMDLIVII
jgi:hypothetical protein